MSILIPKTQPVFVTIEINKKKEVEKKTIRLTHEI